MHTMDDGRYGVGERAGAGPAGTPVVCGGNHHWPAWLALRIAPSQERTGKPIMDAADPDDTSDRTAKPKESLPSPRRGAFPTPRSVIDQAAEYAPEEQATDDEDRPTAPSGADPNS